MCYCKKYKEGGFCDEYSSLTFFALLLNNFVTVLVSIVNIVIRTLNMTLIERIGFDTQSQKTSMIMKSIFVTSFINTGIILLFTNADLEFSILAFVPIRNQYPDLNMDWYQFIAPSLVQTMLIMAVFPYIEIVMYGSINKLKRFIDQGCRRNKNLTTKKTTL